MKETILIIILALVISIGLSSLTTNLIGQESKPESIRYQMIQGRYDRSQLFILDTYTGRFWFIDYWGIPEEEPRVKGPYHITD
jgi:hypothetical protein